MSLINAEPSHTNPCPCRLGTSTYSARMRRPRLPYDEYSVGWICALAVELAAAEMMLDEEHVSMDEEYNNSKDTNLYSLGRIGGHNVVIACIPAGQTGTCTAAAVAMQMKSKFTSIRFGLMVGVGGGVPSDKADIRLGDVIIGRPNTQHGGVVQYDFGKSTPSGFQRTGFLNAPPLVLLNAISRLQANHMRRKSNLMEYLSPCSALQEFCRDSAGPDVLFEPTYQHVEGDTCALCIQDRQIKRQPRICHDVRVHYGTIASGNRVMRDGIARDEVSAELGGVLCFEMEAAGLMNSFPCLVLRGICDYSDSHKNKTWQPYAAATAAACAKEVLSLIPAFEVAKEHTATATISYEILQNVIGSADLDDFLSVLSIAEQDPHKSNVPSLESQPEFSWVFRNTDYKLWANSLTPNPFLLLSAPLERKVDQVSSYIVCRERGMGLRTGRCSLFFFCRSLLKKESILKTFIHTLLYQIIQFSVTDKTLTLKAFFLHLLNSVFEKEASERKELQGLKGTESRNVILGKIVNSRVKELWSALKVVLFREPFHELSVTVDGLGQDDENMGFCFELLSFIMDIKRDMKVKVLLTNQPHTRLNSVFAWLPCIEYDSERKACLSSLHFENTRFSKISKEYGGSCEWLWMHPQYQEWSISNASRILLIQGKPGSGKSTLTRYFSENIRAQQPGIKSAIVARFFYSYREGELQRSHHNMLRSILYDILRQDDAFFYHRFQAEYRALGRIHTGWNYASLKKVLGSLQDYSTDKQFYLIIDAVDESETNDRRNVLKLLLEICSETKFCTVKIFMASRPEGVLDSRRGQLGNFIRLQDETKPEIASFARSFLDGLNLTHVLAQAMKYIVDNAQGVFLWVKLIGEKLLAYYEKGYSEDEIFNYLKRLPTDLKELYEQMFENMDKEEFGGYGMRMFQFVLFGRRSLTVNELLHALATPGDADIKLTLSDFSKRISGERRITHCGGNFLDIKSYKGTSTIQAMHQTVQEFFLDPDGPVAKSGFDMISSYADVYIAKTCVWYLMLCTANIPLVKTTANVEAWTLEHFEYFTQYLNQWPLASYALYHLKDHLDGCQTDPSVEVIVSRFIKQLIHPPAAYLLESWIRSHLHMSLLWKGSPATATNFRNKALHAASRNGLVTATEVLLAAGGDVNTADSEGRTPLSSAAGNGHERVVGLLLECAYIDADLEDVLHRTPLSWAAWNGHEATVRLILNRTNPSLELEDRYHQTPLSWAAWNGHEAVVRQLIHRPHVNPELKDEYGQTPLAWAAWNGQEDVVNLLLRDSRVNPDPKDKYGQTPLSWAAWNGQEAVVKLLANHQGVDPDSKDADGFTPWYWAALNGHEAAAGLLSAVPGVQANLSIDYSQTSLMKAAQRGQELVVWRLLLCGYPAIDAKDDTGRTALHWAIIYGHRRVVRRLLDKGAVIDVEDCDGASPLHWAARNNGDVVMQLLLNNGATIEAKDKYGKTPLHWAVQNGCHAAADLLLRNGAIDV